MGINLGTDSINNLLLGETQVDKVYLGEEEVWSNAPATIRALKFTSTLPQTIAVNSTYYTGAGFTINFEYSNDGETWSSWTDVTTPLSFGDGTDLYLRGSNTLLADQQSGEYTNFVFLDGNANTTCSGNIMHLFDYTQDLTAFPASERSEGVKRMFQNCTALVSTPSLPATTLVSKAYERLFYFCSKITEAPVLPATTLTNNCYSYMFYYCTALTIPPALPAMTLTSGCYSHMFQNCTNLSSIPALPATTLNTSCYEYMFNTCHHILMSFTQDESYPNQYVFGTAPDSTSANRMFRNTGGTFTDTPTQTTYYTANTIIS